MMHLEIHQLYCQKFLHNFSEAQEQMLRMDLAPAANEFELIYNCFLHELEKTRHQLGNPQKYELAYRLIKQIDLIIRYLNEFSASLVKLHSEVLGEDEIVKLFERQYRLKRVLQRHSADLELYLKSGQVKH